ncbi:uncharacterized protein MELLADRAFT_52292 [Melampsora larici-populina 98AG31]|uniref:Uncharacterized protein n=1 Tax=Melampsora larici-populina (strain 98AG31 / pathotype 3-4-7) TaxID=747676 RepID=F4RI02_MELLP|nr:uncharacterized protein MELLADRAFT_52292 [Melampsora larici-populina 98AG31]EGG07910.1 hypothetical protein MELLADRAFT_52292 [Melampsora larici-populina 98AG31]
MASWSTWDLIISASQAEILQIVVDSVQHQLFLKAFGSRALASEPVVRTALKLRVYKIHTLPAYG